MKMTTMMSMLHSSSYSDQQDNDSTRGATMTAETARIAPHQNNDEDEPPVTVGHRYLHDNDIHQLEFLEDELTANNTRYDNIVAGVSPHNRFIQWTVYASIALSVTAFVVLVLIAILRHRPVRRRSFNLFLVFLIIPDFVFSFFCGINCALNAAHGDYISAPWCRFQVVYAVWGIGSNAWLNAAIARHLHQMLQCCACRRRYFAPSRRRVVMESLCVYAWMAFVSSWVFIPFLPHRLALSAGLACLPHEYDGASTLFLWIVFMPCFALIPTAYAFYVAFDVHRRGLLPPDGRARDLALYFGRLVCVFLIMWVPSIFLMFIAGGYTSSWVAFIGGCWSHLQGAVSAIASVMKQDIRESFVELMTCGYYSTSSAQPQGGAGRRPSQQRLSGSFITASFSYFPAGFRAGLQRQTKRFSKRSSSQTTGGCTGPGDRSGALSINGGIQEQEEKSTRSSAKGGGEATGCTMHNFIQQENELHITNPAVNEVSTMRASAKLVAAMDIAASSEFDDLDVDDIDNEDEDENNKDLEEGTGTTTTSPSIAESAGEARVETHDDNHQQEDGATHEENGDMKKDTKEENDTTNP